MWREVKRSTFCRAAPGVCLGHTSEGLTHILQSPEGGGHCKSSGVSEECVLGMGNENGKMASFLISLHFFGLTLKFESVKLSGKAAIFAGTSPGLFVHVCTTSVINCNP